MKIALGTLFLNPGKLGGLENYARGLIRGLSRIDSKNEYVILANQENYTTWTDLPRNFTVHLCPIQGTKKLQRIYYEKYSLGKVLQELQADLYHSMAFGFPPKTKNIPTIITIGDIIFKRFPQDLGFLQRWAMHLSVWYSCRNTQRIVTFSEYSKKDLAEEYNVSLEKIDVALLANNELREKQEEAETYFKQHQIPEQYIFSVASTYHHKNLKGLLKAFSLLKQNQNVPHSLIVTGLKMAGHQEFFQMIEEYHLQKHVFFTGWISEAVLLQLYQKASCFVYPSFYEGFGLPVLEAMVARVAVVSANTTSLPEVYGKAALSFDPHNPLDIAEKIYQCLSDHSLRKELIENGYEQAQRFSWAKCASETLKSYQQTKEQFSGSK
ncbi:MAG: glycosyltransferase family 1 protein [Spirochaetota bacterium]